MEEEEDELVGDHDEYGGGGVGEDVLEPLPLQTFSEEEAATMAVPSPSSAQ
jgi:hypothetical protein